MNLSEQQQMIQASVLERATNLLTDNILTLIALTILGMAIGSAVMSWVKAIFPPLDDAPPDIRKARHRFLVLASMVSSLVWAFIIIMFYTQTAFITPWYVSFTAALGLALLAGALTPLFYRRVIKLGKAAWLWGWGWVRRRLHKDGASQDDIDALDSTETSYHRKDGGSN